MVSTPQVPTTKTVSPTLDAAQRSHGATVRNDWSHSPRDDCGVLANSDFQWLSQRHPAVRPARAGDTSRNPALLASLEPLEHLSVIFLSHRYNRNILSLKCQGVGLWGSFLGLGILRQKQQRPDWGSRVPPSGQKMQRPRMDGVWTKPAGLSPA